MRWLDVIGCLFWGLLATIDLFTAYGEVRSARPAVSSGSQGIPHPSWVGSEKISKLGNCFSRGYPHPLMVGSKFLANESKASDWELFPSYKSIDSLIPACHLGFALYSHNHLFYLRWFSNMTFFSLLASGIH